MRGEGAKLSSNCFFMELRIISWNVWGLNELGKRQIIKAALRRWKPNVVCLQETKMGFIDRRVVSSLGGGRWFDWEFLGAAGSSKGILVMWDKRVVVKMDVVTGFSQFHVALKWWRIINHGYFWGCMALALILFDIAYGRMAYPMVQWGRF